MRRKVGGIVALVSAVLCVLSAALVVRSVWRFDQVTMPISRGTGVIFGAIDGQFVIQLFKPAPEGRELRTLTTWRVRPSFRTFWRELTGVRWLGVGWGESARIVSVILPLWLVPIVTAIPPVRWWRKRRREGGRGFAVDVRTADA